LSFDTVLPGASWLFLLLSAAQKQPDRHLVAFTQRSLPLRELH